MSRTNAGTQADNSTGNKGTRAVCIYSTVYMKGCDERKYCRNRCQVGVGGLSTEAQRDLVAGESPK